MVVALLLSRDEKSKVGNGDLEEVSYKKVTDKIFIAGFQLK